MDSTKSYLNSWYWYNKHNRDELKHAQYQYQVICELTPSEGSSNDQ